MIAGVRSGVKDGWKGEQKSTQALDNPNVAPVAQLDRASVYGTEGCRFEPCQVYFRKPRPGRGFGVPGPSALPPMIAAACMIRERVFQPGLFHLDFSGPPCEQRLGHAFVGGERPAELASVVVYKNEMT